MPAFRHKSGQVFIVPDTVIADYQRQASTAADDDASCSPGETGSAVPDDASRAPENATAETDATPAEPAPRKKNTRKR